MTRLGIEEDSEKGGGYFAVTKRLSTAGPVNSSGNHGMVQLILDRQGVYG